MTSPRIPKKLIEVALPLKVINTASAREKSIRHGHPSTLHLWWARRPLATARAVLYAQLVNDPASLWALQHPDEHPTPQQRASFTKRRKQHFDLIAELVIWENTTNQDLMDRARSEIREAWNQVCQLNRDHPQAASLFDPTRMPGFHDPFAGGGAIPLEAQRLGLDTIASDLNPVAVLINKAMIEIPPKFAGRAPVHPQHRQQAAMNSWTGAQGLAADVRAYGSWMCEQAKKRIGHLYPKVAITEAMAANRQDLKGMVGQELTVIAWLWARTVKSPNPAFDQVQVPLVSSFVLATKLGKEAWVEPLVEGDSYRFEVRMGKPPEAAKAGTKIGRGALFKCLLSGGAIESKHIYSEARAGRMHSRLLAIVAEGERTRVYLDPLPEAEMIAMKASPDWKPELEMPKNPRWFSPPLYGMTTYGDIFTNRQLVSLNTFAELANEASKLAYKDALSAGYQKDSKGIDEGGIGAKAYGQAVGIYLSFAISRAADYGSTVCSWHASRAIIRNTFGRQAIVMSWGYAEGNPFSSSSGNLKSNFEWIAKVVERLRCNVAGAARQADAQHQTLSEKRFVSMDPPYYDNIGFADLSDYFYIWLRRSLRSTFPTLFSTMAVPKMKELVASPTRHGSKQKAASFFLEGMTEVMQNLSRQAHCGAPVTIYYAFKQSETKSKEGTSSTGWETFLEAILQAGFALTGTWPMRTEMSNRMTGLGTNALASCIVLVCRRRSEDACTLGRHAFIRELNQVLPGALEDMTKGAGEEQASVAPVDLSQAIIGPGMAVFSKYAGVLEADGTHMTVRTALQLINQFLADSEYDGETQFCLQWFEEKGWAVGAYGEADVLARAKATSVEGMDQAGLLEGVGGKVRLLKWHEYPAFRGLAQEKNETVWRGLHQLIQAFQAEGEQVAGGVLTQYGQVEDLRKLAYRLYTHCERGGMAEEARAYNGLITAWSRIEHEANTPREQQDSMFGGTQ